MMTKNGRQIFSLVGIFFASGALAFAGEPAGIGEQGTGQLQKSTERQQSQDRPDLSQAPAELREGKTSQAVDELKQEQRATRKAPEPSGIGEKGTGQTQQSTQRQQSRNQPDLSQAGQELREGKTAQAAEELKDEK